MIEAGPIPAQAGIENRLREREEVEEPAAPDRARLGLLSVGHAVTDSYGQSMLAPMYPQIAERLGLTLAQVGGLPMMMGLSASLFQPVLGWLSDRHPRLCMVAFGPLSAALCMGLIGFADNYASLAIVLFLAGLGIGAFHPQGAALARRAGRGSGFAMSAFTVGGNIGFGLAPLLGGLYAWWFGLERFYWCAVPAAAFALVMLVNFYRGPGPASAPPPGVGGLRPAGGEARPVALAALTATVVIRSLVQVGMATFLPFLVEQRFPEQAWPVARSVSVSAFLLASAFAGPIGGLLSDRFGRREVMVGSFLAAPWPLMLGLQGEGYGMIAWLALGAFALMMPHPANVVMAQEYLPASAGVAASLITGFAWGIAQILVWPLGGIADRVSLGTALFGLAFVPLLGILFVAPIPAERRPHRAARA